MTEADTITTTEITAKLQSEPGLSPEHIEQIKKAAGVRWTGEWATVKSKTDAASPRNRRGTFADFITDLVSSKNHQAKDGPAIIGASFGHIPNDKGNFRHKANIKNVSFLTFDMDHKTPEDIQKAIDAFPGVALIVHSSWNDGVAEKEGEPPDTRFRLYILLSRRITVAEHAVLWNWGASKLAAACSSPPDGAAKDASRLSYTLRAKNPKSVSDPWLRVIDGDPLNPDALPGGGDVKSLLAPPLPPERETQRPATRQRRYHFVPSEMVEITADQRPEQQRYLHAALDKACDAVRDATNSGGAHNTLLKEAFSIGGLLDYGVFSFEEALNRLVSSAVSAGFPEHEARRVATDGLNNGQTKPRDLPTTDIRTRTPDHRPAEMVEISPETLPRKKKYIAPPTEKKDGIPTIPITIETGSDKRMTDQAIKALIDANTKIYQRMGELVVVRADDRAKLPGIRWPSGGPRIVQMNFSSLQENMGCVANWVRFDARKHVWVAARVPKDIVKNVMAREEWPFRILSMVFETPTMRIDGSLVDKPGWDETTGIFFEPKPSENWNIPKEPTENDVKTAKAALEEVFQDFPFEKPCHTAAAVASILTLLAGLAFTNRPLFLWDANVRGTGKTLGADVCSIIATGREFPKMVQSADEAEDKKRITALAMVGARSVLVDNITGRFGNAAIDAALTANGFWRDRILGQNKEWSGPLFLTWFASGNNVEVHGDLARRVIPIRMLSEEERPEKRTGFKHPDLRAWVKANRVCLASAGLTILRGYVIAGRPNQKLFNFGSFEEWSNLIRNAMVWAGFADPCEGNEDVQAKADTDVLAFSAVLQSWYDLFKEVPHFLTRIARMKPDENDPQQKEKLITLIDALTNLAPNDKGGGWNARKVGHYFKRYENRVIGGLRVKQCASAGGHNAWKVEAMPHTDAKKGYTVKF